MSAFSLSAADELVKRVVDEAKKERRQNSGERRALVAGSFDGLGVVWGFSQVSFAIKKMF